ncbi:MAG: hypothetical protein QM626_12085 [Microbacterium sp.]|uniref:DUF7882 family protein n=1 Tax=Microbacterium sp. TaxID=51671 RepID=UPI0039E70B70
MGQLYYGASSTPIEVPDRLLAHVKVVVATKLRRGESFTINWTGSHSRESIWVQQSIPLRFVFASPEPETLDPELIAALARTSSITGGLQLSAAEDRDAAVPVRSASVPVAA